MESGRLLRIERSGHEWKIGCQLIREDRHDALHQHRSLEVDSNEF
jgi:hypothetical protein